MPRTYDCPCCQGAGLLSEHPRHEPHVIAECEECEASGQVTRRRREELLAWLEKCRLRPPAASREKRRA